MQQITDTILMVRPINFRMNEQTAVNNYYQQSIDNVLPATIQKQAEEEFDTFVKKLRKAGVRIVVVQDTLEPNTPDSIFPNNWVSFHTDGTVGVYPMFAENRRLERREDILEQLESEGFLIENVVDYTSAEEDQLFLEGTGSIILDRVNNIAYCALSPRADEDLFIEFCEDFEYTPVIFTANQTVNGERKAIYHTNVMMALAEDFAVICLDSIDDKKERKMVLKQLKESGKQIVAITEAQVEQFAGNMLAVKNAKGERITIMSEAAYQSLNANQVGIIEKHSKILYSKINTIETCGGGSVRCMMAEVFLPRA
ncbi:arginine deiminase-related protein [Urechidicola sp. KH5]